jgi:uncharacterized protein (TIGR00645 family)
MKSAERIFEQLLFSARWLMAPMYLGLVVSLGILMVVFLRELAYYAPQVMTMDADKSILVILTLIDLTLAGNLVLIVIFSGYESFVSKLDGIDAEHRPAWMGKVDFSGMKIKLIASIVAISTIHLLKKFMEIGKGGSTPDETGLYWMIALHLVFVASGVLMAAMDWMTARSKGS